MLKDKTAAIPAGNICAMQGAGGQWGLDLAVETHLSLWCLGAGPWGRAEGQLLQTLPGIFSVLQAGGFFPLAPKKMMFGLIQLPLFALSCDVLV